MAKKKILVFTTRANTGIKEFDEFNESLNKKIQVLTVVESKKKEK